MKRRLTVLLATVGMMMFSLVPAASAHESGPCETGRQYAQEHIVPFAHDGILGKTHKPGAHRGFSNVPDVCAAHD